MLSLEFLVLLILGVGLVGLVFCSFELCLFLLIIGLYDGFECLVFLGLLLVIAFVGLFCWVCFVGVFVVAVWLICFGFALLVGIMSFLILLLGFDCVVTLWVLVS